MIRVLPERQWVRQIPAQSPFLNVTFAGQANYQNENARSNHDLNETIRELEKFNKDYFLMAAHVEADNGLWGGLSGGRITELGKSELFRHHCLGFQKISTNSTRAKVQGWLGDWYPAEVEGSDCKSVADVGKGKTTCLKIGAFTFESVKFALLDYKNRVAPKGPKLTHSFLKRIAFEGDKLDSRVIDLSPELNTFIGIRGSGKSTILEAVRYALGISFGKNAADREYKEGSIKHALGSGGKITLTAADRHGYEYEIRRIVGEQPDVYVDGKSQPGINIRETVIHKPIYFGQKDLSNTGQGFETDLVEKLVGERLAEVRQSIAAQAQTVIDVTHRLQKVSDVADKEKDAQAKKQDAEYRLKIFKKHGVEAKLQKQVEFQQDARAIKDLSDFVAKYVQELDQLVTQHAEEFVSQRAYTSKENAAFFSEVFNIYDRVEGGLAEITKILSASRAASTELQAKVKGFTALKNELKEEFAEISRKLSDELKSSGVTAIQPDEFLKLRRSIQDAAQTLTVLSKQKQQQLALNTELISELTKLNDLWHQEFKLIKEQLELINQQETALQIEIDYKGDKAAFLKYLKEMFRGSRLREYNPGRYCEHLR